MFPYRSIPQSGTILTRLDRATGSLRHVVGGATGLLPAARNADPHPTGYFLGDSVLPDPLWPTGLSGLIRRGPFRIGTLGAHTTPRQPGHMIS